MSRAFCGGGALGMGLVPGMGTDRVYFWPIGETGVLGAEASVELFFGKAIKAAQNPQEMREQMIKEFVEKYSSPMREASVDWAIEDVIEPGATRRVLIRDLEFLAKKKRGSRFAKWHGNIPM